VPSNISTPVSYTITTFAGQTLLLSTSRALRASTVGFTASLVVDVEALPSEREEARVSLVASPEWSRFLRGFDASPYLMKPHHINNFERMDRYYKESNLVRAADDLAYTIAAKLKGWTYEELLADEEKEAQCAIIAESI
jgi:hypothetical protein